MPPFPLERPAVCRSILAQANHRALRACMLRVVAAGTGTIGRTGGARVTVWFTVKLDDRPGALARMATALADRGVNIAGIVGIAEDTNGELMLETSNAEETRAAFDAAGIDYQAHDADSASDPGQMSIADIIGR